MSYLRLVHSVSTVPTLAHPCLDAFSSELDYVYETLRRLGAVRQEIDELVQEVFLVLHRSWTLYDPSRPLRPYLFGIAFRAVSAHGRRRSRERPQAMSDLEDGDWGSERTTQERESLALLRAGLERVPLRRRAVLILHDLDEVPIEEIARTLAISRFRAASRLVKARKDLTTAIRRLQRIGARR